MRSFNAATAFVILLGQVSVIDGSSHGDRTDEDTECEDRFAFPDVAVGVVNEVSDHGEAFLHLTGVAALGEPPARATSAATPSPGWSSAIPDWDNLRTL